MGRDRHRVRVISISERLSLLGGHVPASEQSNDVAGGVTVARIAAEHRADFD